MRNVIEGQLIGNGIRAGIIVSRFNDFITEKLLEGALDGLRRHGVKEEDISIIRVPGSFEIPLIASKAAKSGRYDGLICLGAVIRGETPHFEYVSAEVSKGIAKVALDTGVPVIFAVLTTDNIEQAIARAGTKHGNKGFDAALSLIEMVNLMKAMSV